MMNSISGTNSVMTFAPSGTPKPVPLNNVTTTPKSTITAGQVTSIVSDLGNTFANIFNAVKTPTPIVNPGATTIPQQYVVQPGQQYYQPTQSAGLDNTTLLIGGLALFVIGGAVIYKMNSSSKKRK